MARYHVEPAAYDTYSDWAYAMLAAGVLTVDEILERLALERFVSLAVLGRPAT